MNLPSMRIAYMDESGTHTTSEWVVVAGFMGKQEQWDAFLPDWIAGLGQRRSLHMNELRWGHRRTPPLLEKLGKLPDKHGLERIFCAVRFKDYKDLIVLPLEDLLGSAYMLACHVCFTLTLMHLPPEETVHFFFEQQDRYAPLRALPKEFYGEQFRTPDGTPRIEGVTYKRKDETPLFQVADYLASAISHAVIDQTSKKAKMTEPILGDRMMIGRQLSREQAREIINGSHTLMELYRDINR